MSEKKYKVLLFTSNLGSRQAEKIMDGFCRSDNVEEVAVCGFLRDVEPPPKFKCKIFGRIRHKRYLERLWAYSKSILWLAKNISKFDAVFTWTVDSAMVLYFSKMLGFSKAAFIYNVRDVHRVLTEHTLLGRVARAADKFISERADLIMLTSPYYQTMYYEKWLSLKNRKFYLLENKVPPQTCERFNREKMPAKPLDDDITIGYFGMMSYEDRIFDMMKAISRNGLKFYLRGHNYKGQSFVDGLAGYENIEYGGGYKNPEDMGNMFSKIDLAWAVDSDLFVPDTNEAWSMCNRFYEGLFFKKPLIVQDFTPASHYVKKYGIGICVDNRDPEGLVKKVSSITKEDILRWRANVEKLDPGIFMLSAGDYEGAVEEAVGTASVKQGRKQI